MIKGFRHKGLKRLFENDDRRGVPPDLSRKIRRQLDYLNAAAAILDLDLPGYDLQELKGNLQGTWAISVAGNWRITFRFEDSHTYDVDFEDYHR